MQTVNARSFPRAGLLGNPSDGYFGKTLSFAFADYCVDLKLTESAKMRFVPGEVDDAMFDSPRHLVRDLRLYGYYGGIRMLKAVAKLFFEYCEEHGIAIPERNFTAEYRTNIPRLVGLSGSSAICSAMLKALCKFYEVPLLPVAAEVKSKSEKVKSSAVPNLQTAKLPNLSKGIPLDYAPTICLEAEKFELGINCGFQDRVIQMYGGLVFMDFNKAYVEAHNKGIYEELDPAIFRGQVKVAGRGQEGMPNSTDSSRFGFCDDFAKRSRADGCIQPGVGAQVSRNSAYAEGVCVPKINLYIAFDPNRAEESGKAHKKVKKLFEEKKPDILSAMSEFADIAQQGRDLIVAMQQSDQVKVIGQGQEGMPNSTDPSRVVGSRSDLRSKFSLLVDANFNLRDRIFNVAEENRRMVMMARSVGASAKFAGSGGAIVGTFEDAEQFDKLKAALATIGCTTFVPTIGTRDLESAGASENGKWRNS